MGFSRTLLFAVCLILVVINRGSCIKPEWQRILQDEGKTVKVVWSLNGNMTLKNCLVRDHNKQIVGGYKNPSTRLTTYASDTAMVYGTNLAFLISPFNSSMRTGRYTLEANMTNGVVDVVTYEVEFELALKSDKDKEEELINIEKNDDSDDLSPEAIISIAAGCIGFCILVMLVLIHYRNTHIDDDGIKKNAKAK